MMNLSKRLATASDDDPWTSELIEQNFSGIAGIGRRCTTTISRNADFITNFYLHVHKTPICNRVVNFHKIVDKLDIEIGGSRFSVIPILYIALYNRIIKNINIDSLSNKKRFVLPVNLHDLINCPFIRLPTHHEVRLNCQFGSIDQLNLDVSRKINLDVSWPILLDKDDIQYVRLMPKDIWKMIMERMTDRSWANIRQTCKFFYSLNQQSVINERYQKYKINGNDIMNFDCNIKHMYHMLSKKQIENGKLQKFVNEIRSVEYDSKYVNNANAIIIDDLIGSRSEWIIIDIEHYEKCILDAIDFRYVAKGQDEIDEHNACIKRVNEYIAKSSGNNDVYRIVKDDSFYEKMNNPLENRYMFYLDDTESLIKSITISFKKNINAKINIYRSFKSWCVFTHEIAGRLY